MHASLTDGVVRRVMSNGVTVLVRPAHASPVVAINTWVKAGYFHEPDEKAGMAHLFEHMFFKGSERFPGAERIGEEVSALGGVLNAGTIYDSTNYYFVLPRDAFERGVAIQADAVIHPLFDAEELRKEAEVVIEESNRKYDNPPAYATERMFSFAFSRHRMKRWRIGDHEVLRNIRREDLLAFFHDLYRPENIIVCVVGDVDPERALEIVDREFSPLARGEMRKERGPEEPLQEAFRFQEERKDLSQSRLLAGWHTRGYGHADNEPLEILSTLLGSGKSSRLYRCIVGPDLAGGVMAYNYPVDDVGMFVIQAQFPGARQERVELALFRELERIRRQPPDQQEVDTAREQLLAGFLLGQEEVLGQSLVLASREARGDYQDIDRYVERIKKVAPADVSRVAAAYLRLENTSLFRYLENDAPEAAKDPLEVGRSIAAVLSEVPEEVAPIGPVEGLLGGDVVVGSDAAGRSTRVEKLQNGVDLVIQEFHHVPTVWFGAYFRGGRIEETRANAGITRATLSGALRGTRRRTAEELDRAIESLGTGFAADFYDEFFGLSAALATERLPAAMGLLREVITEATFPKAGVEKAREVVLTAIRAARDSSLAHPFDLFVRAYFGAEHPLGLPARGDFDAVSGLTAADLATWYRRCFDPGRLTLVVVGDINPEKVKQFAEEHFGRLPASSAQLPETPAVEPPGSVVEVVESRPRRQTAFLMGFQAAPLGTPDYYALEVLQHVVSGMAGRFFRELRGKRSLAYTVMAGDMARPGAGYFYGYIAGDHRKEEAARRGMLEEFQRLKEEPVSEEELARAKSYMAGVTTIRLQTNSQRGGELVRNHLFGVGTDFTAHYLREISTVSAADVLRAARDCFDAERYAIGVLRGGD